MAGLADGTARWARRGAVALAALALCAGGARAEDGSASGPGGADTSLAAAEAARALAPPPIPGARAETGRVTGRPLPRFAALKRDRARVRRGPGRTYRVDWEFVRRGMPLEIVAEHGNWRRVRDIEGAGGWVHYALLTGRRSGIVLEDMLPLRSRPSAGAPEVARAEAGAMVRVERCEAGWCRLRGDAARGWAPDTALWGVRAGEVFD